jgi:hypothetical protein
MTKGTNDATKLKKPAFAAPLKNKRPCTSGLKFNSHRHDVIPTQILITNGIR